MMSRMGYGLLLVVVAGGCADGGTTSTSGSVSSAEPAVLRQDGLSVGPALRVGKGVAALRGDLRRQGAAFSARGAQHQLQLVDGRTRIRGIPSSVELRRAAELRRRDRNAARPLLPAALELETRSVARGDHESMNTAAAWSAGMNGNVERRFEHGLEQWSNREAGAEVAYQFSEPPAGEGDVVVSVRVASDGAAGEPISATSDARGLHLQMRDGRRFFYEHATWIDARGTRTAVPARWKGTPGARSIELVVPAALVNASRYPAVLDPLVGPDLGTDTPVLTQVSAGLEPDVASDGSNYLAVFEDAQRIRAVRVDVAGHVLDGDWIDLGEDGKLQFDAAVTYGDGHYLVAWWEDDGTDVSIRSRLLNQDGTLVGSGNVTLSSEVGFDAALAWNGSSFLASWIGYGDVPGIRVAQVGTDGQVVPGSEHHVSSTSDGSHPSLAVGTGGALVAWQERNSSDFTNRLRAARIELDGDVLDPGGFRLSSAESDENQAHVASDGDRFLVVWHGAGASGLPGAIHGAVVDEQGVITAPAFPISRSTGEASVPSVAFDGEAFAVAWKDERAEPAVRGALVSSGGVVSGTEDSVLSNVPASAAGFFDSTGLAWNGSQFLLVFQGNRANGGNAVVGIEGSLLGPDLSLVPGPLGLSQLRAGKLAPQVVWNGRNYVVSWIDERAGSFDLATPRAVRINPQGEVLDPDGIALSDDVPAIGQIASNGDGPTLVTLVEPSGAAQFRFMGAGGRLRPSNPLGEGVTGGPAAVAGNGTNFLSVMTHMHPDFSFDVSGRVVRADGTVGPSFAIEPETNGTADLVAAGNGYLVASWSNGGTLFPVGAAGRVGTPISLPLASTSLSSATDGTDTLVAWIPGISDQPFAAEARFFASGRFHGPTLEIAPTTDASLASLAWDGRKYWAVWSLGDGSRPFIRSISRGGRLGPVSQLLDEECRGPVLASNGRRQLLLSCYAFTNQFRVVNVSTHLIDTSAAAGQ
jgi:hypothetical protein